LVELPALPVLRGNEVPVWKDAADMVWNLVFRVATTLPLRK